MKKLFLVLLVFVVSQWQGMAQTLVSPNEKISVKVETNEGKTGLSVLYNGQVAVEHIALGLTVDDTDYSQDVTIDAVGEQSRVTEAYTMPHGKRTTRNNEANALVVTLVKDDTHKLGVEIRAYNDGLCFRYLIDNAEGKALTFSGEHTAYTLPADAPRWLQQFVTSYEGDFPLQQGAERQGAWNYPLLVEVAPCFMLITEANPSREYCSTHVSNEATKDTYQLAYPYQWEGNGKGAVNPVSEATAWQSPWRVVILGSLGDIVESTLVEDVSDATIITDTDWIEPGSAAWVYWAYNHGTKDYKICCQYVDLAVAMGWEYVLFDWEWDSMTNGGKLEDAAAYAVSKGVKPLLWYNSGGAHNNVSSTPRDRFLTHESRMKELAWLKGLGFAGVKIDFFESDKQSMMQYYLDILQDCADAQMLVNFHGSTLPRGWSRTFPNLVSMESVYGAEQYNNSPTMTDIASRLNCTLPFTRNVVGAMDYTPVAFTNSQHPHATTYAHELALSVAFESGVQHWADRPEGFYALPYEAKLHMQTVPTAWDETRFIDGYPGTHFVVARCSGTTWYVAGLNGDKVARDIALSLDFLAEGEHLMTCMADGEHGSQFSITHRMVAAADQLTISCLAQGGFVLKFAKASYAELKELISQAETLLSIAEANKGTEPGQYAAEKVAALQTALATAKALKEDVSAQEVNLVYIALADAFSSLQTAGIIEERYTRGVCVQPKGGGTDVTELYLGEARKFSRSDKPKELTYSRFGLLASPWMVTDNILNQDNGTHGGFDSYENGRYISIEKWDDGLPTITEGAIYQTTSAALPAGKYHLHLPMTTIWDALDDGEIVMQVVEGADFMVGDVLASYDMQPRSNSHNFTPLDACHFELSEPTTVSIGWKVNIPAHHSRRGMRVQAIYLYEGNNNVSATFMGNYENIQRCDEPNRLAYYRFGKPTSWTVENYEIDNGGNGVKRGIDNFTGENCLQLGRWEESTTTLKGANHENSRLYQQVILPEGRYYFGASYHYIEPNRIGNNAYIFVSDKVMNTTDVSAEAIAYGTLSSAGGGSTLYGVEFQLDEQQEVVLGWQMDSNPQHSEFRAQQVQLIYYGAPISSGIEEVQNATSSAELQIYTLTGQRITTLPAKGIFIVGNKKVVLK